MNTKEVSSAVRVLFGNYEHPICNSFIFDWESDFFAISKSGYSVEVEVKVSKADFKKDFTHKVDKHKIFTRHRERPVCLSMKEPSYRREFNRELNIWEKITEDTHVRFVKPCDKLPNKFYYACPEGLIRPREVPAYAGLIYTRAQYDAFIVKPAPFLHKEKRCFNNILVSKYYRRNNEVAGLLSYYVRRNDLTDQQSKDLCGIMERLR